jgi:hypothetical protein
MLCSWLLPSFSVASSPNTSSSGSRGQAPQQGLITFSPCLHTTSPIPVPYCIALRKPVCMLSHMHASDHACARMQSLCRHINCHCVGPAGPSKAAPAGPQAAHARPAQINMPAYMAVQAYKLRFALCRTLKSGTSWTASRWQRSFARCVTPSSRCLLPAAPAVSHSGATAACRWACLLHPHPAHSIYIEAPPLPTSLMR